MGRGDDYASFDGDDDSGAASFGEGPSEGVSPEVLARAGGSSGGSPARRHSRGGMSPGGRPGRGSSGHGRTRGRSGSFRLNAGSLREAAGSMLIVAVAGVVICALIIYFTFVQAAIPQFYGSLAASAVVMFLLCYVAARLLAPDH